MHYDSEDRYQSMHRTYEAMKVLATNIGKTVDIGDHAAGDAVRSFFIECYHLKDYLIKDSRVKNPKDVEAFITASTALSLAADLCNSFKHAGLNRASRSGKKLDRINMAYSLDLPANADPGTIKISKNPSDGDTITISNSNRIGHAVATAKVVLTIDGKKYEALAVADQCINDWDSFLVSQGIVFSKL